MSKHIPGHITITPTGVNVAAQTVTFGGVAYEIPEQVLEVTAVVPTRFRLVLTKGTLVLDETPVGEEPDAVEDEVLVLVDFDLHPDQVVTGLIVARHLGGAVASRVVQVGTAQRRAPSAKKQAQRALRDKLGRGDVLTPQEVSTALRLLLGM